MERKEIYLEIREDESARYWHLVQEAERHTLRFGSLTMHSETEQEKLFTTEDEARREFDKRARQKLRQGWTEQPLYPELELPPRPPVMLDYEPVDPATLAQFTPAMVSRASEQTLRQWQRLNRPLYEGLALTGELTRHHHDLQPMELALHEIASWDCPDMTKEVKRTPAGLVIEIAYHLNGQWVLSLERGQLHAALANPRWRTFWHRKKPVDTTAEALIEDARIILSRFSQLCAAQLPTIIAKEDRRVKDQKVKSVAEGNITLLVQNLMQEQGYQYHLQEGAKGLMLRVELGEDHIVELSLPYKTFLRRMGEILPTLTRVQQLAEEAPLYLVVDSSIDREGLRWGGMEREPFPDQPGMYEIRDEFWAPLVPEWFDPNAFFTETHGEDASALLPELLETKIPGLRMEPSWMDEPGSELWGVEVWYDDRHDKQHLLHIRKSALDLHFSETHYYFHRVGGAPPMAQWLKLLVSLVPFYERHAEAYQQVWQQALARHEAKRQGRHDLEATIRRLMKGIPHEWALALLQPWYKWPGRLYIQLATRRVLCLHFDYQDFAPMLEEVPRAIALVQEAEQDCKLAYKLLRLA
ncbi:MAG: hypothetical protein CSA07_00205 [Bacteroidia bacterium]|nr:MAG: hypothetical protein CSA07_00205 [Bacteroidia bacterium]